MNDNLQDEPDKPDSTEVYCMYKHWRLKKDLAEHGVAFAFWYQRGRTEWMPHERGGATQCFIKRCSDGAVVAIGFAECSIKDTFCYAKGRRIARGRALAALKGEPVQFTPPTNTVCVPELHTQVSIRVYPDADLTNLSPQ
uniref:Uncharacterized protein n=1 Tax=viral metagenome TaxID=1070528 RepID=A0A6M3L9R5_9ZZZZ